MNKGLETIKNITKDKNKEKLIYILVCAVVILIASSYIFSEEKINSNELKVSKEENETYIYNVGEIEQRLSNILGKIQGVSDISCFITYKDSGTLVPAFNEKEVIYQENGSTKEIVIEKTLTPSIEGVIIVGKGMENVELQSKVATAVASVMNIGVYKVQIFSKGE